MNQVKAKIQNCLITTAVLENADANANSTANNLQNTTEQPAHAVPSCADELT